MRISDWSSDVCSSDLQLDIGEIDQRAGDLLEVERVITVAHQSIEFRKTVQHQLFEFGQIGIGDLLALIMGERAEHPADGVAQLAVGVDIRLDDRLARSEEHTSELQSLMRISYAVF